MVALALEDYSTEAVLNKKAFETIEWLFVGLENGRLTEDQFSVGVDALFMAVSGLVDKDFINLITESQAMCAVEKFVNKRVFYKGLDHIKITWSPGDTAVMIATIKGDHPEANVRKIFDGKSPKEALAYFKSIGTIMIGKGWTEL